MTNKNFAALFFSSFVSCDSGCGYSVAQCNQQLHQQHRSKKNSKCETMSLAWCLCCSTICFGVCRMSLQLEIAFFNFLTERSASHPLHQTHHHTSESKFCYTLFRYCNPDSFPLCTVSSFSARNLLLHATLSNFSACAPFDLNIKCAMRAKSFELYKLRELYLFKTARKKNQR